MKHELFITQSSIWNIYLLIISFCNLRIHFLTVLHFPKEPGSSVPYIWLNHAIQLSNLKLVLDPGILIARRFLFGRENLVKSRIKISNETQASHIFFFTLLVMLGIYQP